MTFPKLGLPREAVLEQLEAKRAGDADWHGGRVFGYVYNAGDEVTELLKMVYERFGMTNALNPMAFPSLRECEAETLEMTADLLHGKDAVGTVNTGGTESICLAVKTAREWARAERGERSPEMVLPITVHPAFHKAAHYFDVKPVTVPIGADYRVDLDALRDAVNEHTILLVGSAPCFPYGVVDPIEEIAALAAERGLLCHVDACLGGFMLPFVERLGHPVPPFDFRVEGVTSLTADLHKYGYTAKGASTVLYRDRALRLKQFFSYTEWPGGMYASPSMTGARGGGPIAAAWAVLKLLGEDGYLRLARDAMGATEQILEGVRGTAGLSILGAPAMTVLAFGSEELDVYAVSELMEQHGWHLDRLQLPPALHMTVSPIHHQVVGRFLEHLRGATKRVADEGLTAQGAGAMYGMLADLPDRGQVHELILQFLDGMY